VFGAVAALVASLLSAPPAAAAPPANDDIANAVVVPDLGFSATADTREATYVATDPGCGAATVWYTFTPTTNGRVVFENVGSDYDTMLAVLTGPASNPSLITCHDDDVDFNERIVLDVTAGTTYYIQAGTCCGAEDGQVGPGGNLVFGVSAAPPPMRVGASINRRGVATRFGAAQVRGTRVCHPNAEYAEIGVRIRQRQGDRVVTAWAGKSLRCTTTRRTWTVTLENDSRSFKRKLAQVRVNVFACDGITCDDVTRQRTVRLRARW
jgi:hypothetical protein